MGDFKKSIFGSQTFETEEKSILGQLAQYLKLGNLSLIVGAGLSKSIGLPSWNELIGNCLIVKGLEDRYFIDHKGEMWYKFQDGAKKKIAKLDEGELSDIAELIKEAHDSESDYLKTVSEALYKDFKVDFFTSRNGLLIALTTMIVNSSNSGSVDKILSLNFDSVLEWFLKIFSLNVQVVSNFNELISRNDVEITHIHGYLPHPAIGIRNSEHIVFSWSEVEKLKVSSSRQKEMLTDFYKSKVFLTVGVHPRTVVNYIVPFLIDIVEPDNQDSLVKRNSPMGYAIFPENEMKKSDRDKLIRWGVIPIEMGIPEIPTYLLNVSQKSVGVKLDSKLS